MSRPAGGLRVLLTRPEGMNDAAARRFEELGAHVIVEPLTRTAPLDEPDYVPLDAFLGRLPEYDWILFTSVNGVHYYLERARAADVSPFPASVKIAAVGPATAGALAVAGRPPDLVPKDFRAEGLVAAFRDAQIDLAGRVVMFVRALEGRDVLIRELAAAGARINFAPAYRTVTIPENAARAAERIAAGDVDLVVATSGLALDALAAALPGDAAARGAVKIAALGPVTADHARKLGFTVALVPPDATLDSLIATVAAEGGRPKERGH